MNRAENKMSVGKTLLLALLVTALTALVFALSCQNGFVNFYDPDYVTENGQVQRGISTYSLRWAFTTFHAGHWHPLTWISHMADCQMWKLVPAGHHLTSVLLHSLNALMVFLLLKKLTRAIWCSLTAALLFALHPLRVESVVWIAERKDVLSLFFGLLSLWFYVRYVGTDDEASEPSSTVPAGHYSSR